MPQRPSAERIGKTLRGALKNIGKLAAGKPVLQEAAGLKKPDKALAAKATLPRPVITAGLTAHRRSIASRAASPRTLSGKR